MNEFLTDLNKIPNINHYKFKKIHGKFKLIIIVNPFFKDSDNLDNLIEKHFPNYPWNDENEFNHEGTTEYLKYIYCLKEKHIPITCYSVFLLGFDISKQILNKIKRMFIG